MALTELQKRQAERLLTKVSSFLELSCEFIVAHEELAVTEESMNEEEQQNIKEIDLYMDDLLSTLQKINLSLGQLLGVNIKKLPN